MLACGERRRRMPSPVADKILLPARHRSASSSFGPKTSWQHSPTRHRRERSTEDGNDELNAKPSSTALYKLAWIKVLCDSSQGCTQHRSPTRMVLMNSQLNDQVAVRPSGARAGIVRALRRELRKSCKLSTVSKVCSLMTLLQRRRKGSGDLPGLQSRRFGPSRVEWWIRLPHASARSEQKKSQNPHPWKPQGCGTQDYILFLRRAVHE